jgi:hypothetical protein
MHALVCRGCIDGNGQASDNTGYTLGVARDTQYPINSSQGSYLDVPHLASAPGCAFSNPPSGYQNAPSGLMRYDIAYIPTQDYYNNPTATTLARLWPFRNEPVV